MRSLSSVICFLGFVHCLFGQNPHGAELTMNCASCHSPAGWEISAEYWEKFNPQKPRRSRITGQIMASDTLRFHHDKTHFPLTGQHAQVDCRQCHASLVFSEANTECLTCHTDVHQQTLGTDCARCHTTNHWLVDNITSIHIENGFPLTGVHQAVSCEECHQSASTLQFNSIGNQCVDCHRQDYQASTNPNHPQAGFSTDCAECHNPFTPDWTTDKVDHGFFPLTKGHDVQDCARCHQGGDYANTPNNCVACHQADFESTTNPNHSQAGFPTDCAQCHTTDPDWTPAQYLEHDAAYFPIYSGKHQGQWSACTDCHTNPSNYAEYTCTGCHVNPETDDAHAGVNGYVYQNSACLACHPTGDAGVAFDHNSTDFPLTGAHLAADCIECHAAGYPGTPTQCASCHTNDFNQAANPNHAALGIPQDCAMCHTTEPGWSPASFPIHNDYYVLNGAHAAIASDCAACHNGNYNNTPNTCAGCHTSDYNATTDPNHVAAQFPTDCAQCHTESAWAPSSFDHNAIWPFTGAHQAIADDCNACHQGNYTNTPNTCAGCHTTDYNAATNPNHAALAIPTDCAMCHTTNPGWDPATFPIHNDYYAQNGAHAAIANDCATCHNGNYNNTPNTCAGCHTPDYNATTNPNHQAAQFPTDCAICHNESAWGPSGFDHNTIYPLNGAHAAIANDCNLCHNGNYTNTPNTCAGCHTPDYNATTNPNHQAAQFPTDCAVCHNENAWAPSSFDHNAIWPFTGAHIPIADDCNACHQGNYTNTPNTCAGCHTPDYNATSNPNHVALAIPTDCAMCHTTNPGWDPASFPIHNDYYPLNGAHAAVASDCASCHNGNYNNTPNTCAGCHTPDYNATTAPNHQAAQFPTDCAVCHNENAWAPSGFDHNAIYPLNGAHAAIASDCNLCHQGNYTNTPNTCAGCHTPDYNATTNPNHQAAQFPTDCAICHNESAWAPSTFDHNAIWPFTGAHIPIADDCNACHQGNYTNTPNTCAGCHTTDYNATTNPNHVVLAIPTDCALCHTTDPGWDPATFPIHNDYYALNGAHAAIATDCATCHNGNYNNTPNTCAGCHTPDYNATTDPNHAAAQFPTDCAICHGENAWAPTTFDHNAIWPFTGAHIPIADDCNACHHGNYTNTPNTCAGCHTPDYNASTNPNHQALAIPTDCAMCHTTDPGWDPASFPIHNDYYPLNGAHAAIANDCATCHNGNYNNTPNTCAGCHTPDYNATTNPNHQAAQFPTDCAICHNENAWAPSGFDHNAIYPLNGAHAAIANDCNLCHNGNYTNTPNTCAGCHTPDYNATTNPNHAASQFPTDCNLCHTETAWSPSTFDHNAIWPFTGAHIPIADDCNACHQGNYTNTPNTCAGCHTPDYNATTNPNHVALAIPTDCAMCHTTDPGWDPATFPIHNNYYALNGAHAAIANDCATCHNGNYNNTPNTCASCHTPDYNATTNPNHAASQFPTDCNLCHTETAWSPSTFDHNAIWPFTGAHIPIADDCNACHQGNYTNTPNTCAGCHTTDYNASTNPNHQALGIPTDCAMCHTTDPGWDPATFPIHNNYYALNGAHAAIANDCATCHNGNYNNTPNTCASCHTPDYNATTNPNHAASQFPTDCNLCHTETAWSPSTFDHNAIWPFTGAHIPIADDCNACHQGNYTNTPNTCAGCHTTDYNASTNPNHQALGIPTDCAMCHTTDPGWDPATFPIHNNYYALNGAHAAIANDCATCHNGNYNNTPNTCAGCHTPDYNATTNPNHAAAQFPTDCAQCHTETAWSPATFDHNTIWPLVGAHATIANDCNLCHNGNYTNTPNTCAGCHTPDYNATTNPNHQSAQFPTDCALCHNSTAWSPSTFDHNTIWPFTGAHIPIADDCNACHQGNYTNTPNTCAGCHTPDYNSSTNPNHQALGLPTDCAMCHTTDPGWDPASFPIHNNYYQLNGAHALIADNCAGCHNGNYNNTPNTCAGCHTPDYNATTNPNHQASQFPTDCAVCHTETAWSPSTFDHNAIWPFTGAHIPIANDCNGCHQGNYTNTPNTCAGCHTPDYNSSTNPNHQALAIPTDCAMCHTTDPGWDPAIFPIHNNYYQLNGAHALIADNCATCHNGNYNNTPNTCYGCHQSDYNSANNPDHNSANFPTDCTLCHSENAWNPATFDHDNQYFPIYDGKHEGEWNQCVECHTTPNNYAAFSCIQCHEHDDPAYLADKHDDVPGYQYSSPACYSCHPDGEKN